MVGAMGSIDGNHTNDTNGMNDMNDINARSDGNGAGARLRFYDYTIHVIVQCGLKLFTIIIKHQFGRVVQSQPAPGAIPIAPTIPVIHTIRIVPNIPIVVYPRVVVHPGGRMQTLCKLDEELVGESAQSCYP